MRILLALLDRAGDVVTRDELAGILWPDNTDVDVEHGLNSAVRRLRDSLGDSVGRPAYIETVPRIGYRFIGIIDPQDSAAAAPAHVEEAPRTDTSVAAEPPRKPTRPDSHRPWWIIGPAIAALLAAAAFIVDWRVRMAGSSTSTAPAQPSPVPLTFDGGLQTDPSFSPDGQQIAYASNHTGNFEIYVRRLSRGDAVQITSDPAADSQPDWSPDGSRLVFRSERAGGGLFVARATGDGATVQISDVGFRPRWSDGNLILYAGTVPTGLMNLQVIDAAGGPPRQRPGPALGAFGWQPRSSTVLTLACLAGEFQPALVSWDVSGPSATPWTVADSVTAEFRAQRLEVVHGEELLASPDMSSLYFVGSSRGARALWRIEIDAAAHRVVSGPSRVTALPMNANSASLSADGRQVVVDGAPRNAQILSFQLGPDDRQMAHPEELTLDTVHAEGPTLSRDGRAFAFVRHRPGSPERSELVAQLPGDSRQHTIRMIEHPREVVGMARWNHDGTKLAYYLVPNAEQDAARQQLMLFHALTGEHKQLTSAHDVMTMEFPTGWTPDGSHVVAISSIYVPGQTTIALLPVDKAPAAERARQVITSSRDGLAAAVMSPDGRWIAFRVAGSGGRRGRIAVVSAKGGEPSTWVFVTTGDYNVDKPAWSEDGATLYFVSSEGGAMNVWGVGFDTRGGNTIGERFRLTHFDGPGAHLLPNVRVMELSVGGGHFVVPVVRPKGGLWLLERPAR